MPLSRYAFSLPTGSGNTLGVVLGGDSTAAEMLGMRLLQDIDNAYGQVREGGEGKGEVR